MLDSITNLINRIADLLGGGISTILMTLAFIGFLLAIINFIFKRSKGDANGMKQAGNMLWWSVFALFVMVAVWGIVNFLAVNILGSDANKRNADRPQTNFGGSYNKSTTGTNSNQGSTFNSSGQLQGCYQYNNSECLAHSECKTDTLSGCVPR
ncbi:MAG: hypothetical protein QG614_539 [Patescibacteria group bacterium]|nr:hypothetical protein [Patescibacteria group bacterium]